VQEALLAAAIAWSTALPDNPAGWLTTVATRRLTDLLRSEQARRRREQTEAVRTLPPGAALPLLSSGPHRAGPGGAHATRRRGPEYR
jgi:DNA-directed RNA polymerase specialized sigma24 family protein